MRIGFDATVLTTEKGGAANYLCRLIQNLVRLRPQTEIVLFSPERILVDYEPVLNVPNIQRVVLNLSSEDRKYWPARQLPPLLKEYRIEVFHQPDGAGMRIFFPPCPAVVTVLDLAPWVVKGLRQGWFRQLRYQLRNIIWSRLAARIITISEHGRQDIMRLCRVSGDQVIKTHLGSDQIYDGPVSADEAQMILQKYQLAGKHFVVSPSGLSHRRRNPDLVLDGFALFRRHAIQDVYLVFTGSVSKTDGYYERIARKIEMLGLKDRVIITGFLTDKALHAILSKAEASIVTSLYEGFASPVIESFSCGVPVIANNRGAIPEVAGDAAILLDPYDVEGLATALQRLLENPEERNTFIAKGRERARQFSWENMAIETLNVYQSVLKK